MKFLLLGLCIVGAFFAIIFINKPDLPSPAKVQSNLQCDLNKNDCYDSSGKVSFSLTPRPVMAMVPTTLKINGLSGNFDNLNARLNGINMDMGEIRVDLEKRGDSYAGVMVISSCVVSAMQYKVELFDNDKKLNISTSFELRH